MIENQRAEGMGGTPQNRVTVTGDFSGHLPQSNELPQVAGLSDGQKLILREALAALKTSEATESVLYQGVQYIGAAIGVCYVPGTVKLDHASEKELSLDLSALRRKGYIAEYIDMNELMTFMGNGQLVLAYRLTSAGREAAEALDTPVNPR